MYKSGEEVFCFVFDFPTAAGASRGRNTGELRDMVGARIHGHGNRPSWIEVAASLAAVLHSSKNVALWACSSVMAFSIFGTLSSTQSFSSGTVRSVDSETDATSNKLVKIHTDE